MQYGGRSGSWSVLALIYLVYKWHAALDSPGSVVRIMFLNFRKAYDLIDLNIMLEICCKIGIRPALVTTWLASYLNGRTQITKYGSKVSDKCIAHGGVPQGSKTGPVAFIVHINGFPLMLKQSVITHSEDMQKSDEDDDDGTIIFMDDAIIAEIIDIKNHIAGEAIGNAERNMMEVMKFTKLDIRKWNSTLKNAKKC